MQLGKSNCSACTGLIRLCSGLDFFPADAEVRKLLAESLHRAAKTHGHAEQMIQHWLETATAAPKVADLVRLSATVHGDRAALPPPCQLCAYGGGTWGPVVERSGCTGVGRCTCARGEALRRLDRQREQESKAAQVLAEPAPAIGAASRRFIASPSLMQPDGTQGADDIRQCHISVGISAQTEELRPLD